MHMLRSFRLSTFVATVVALACSGHVAAQTGPTTLQGASTIQDAGDNLTTIENTGNGETASNGIATATAIWTGDSALVSLSIKPGSTVLEGARAIVWWYFTVLGPVGISQVPIVLLADGRISAQKTPGNLFDADGDIYTTIPGVPQVHGEVYTASRSDVDFFALHAAANVVDNVTYMVQESVSARSYGGTSSAIEASIDPFVSFADDFDSDGFTIVESAATPIFDPSAVTTVPEPSTPWILGAGMLAWLGARRRRVASDR